MAGGGGVDDVDSRIAVLVQRDATGQEEVDQQGAIQAVGRVGQAALGRPGVLGQQQEELLADEHLCHATSQPPRYRYVIPLWGEFGSPWRRSRTVGRWAPYEVSGGFPEDAPP